MPLIAADESDCPLDSTDSDILEMRQENESLPDDPYLASEKPPLI